MLLCIFQHSNEGELRHIRKHGKLNTDLLFCYRSSWFKCTITQEPQQSTEKMKEIIKISFTNYRASDKDVRSLIFPFSCKQKMHNHLNPEDGRKENNEISTLYLRKNKLPEHPFILDLNDDQSGPKKCTRKKPQRWKYNISFLRTECLWKQQILIFPYHFFYYIVRFDS